MDISARAVLLADRPRMGHLGHQCSHAPVRPILHLVSSSRRPRRETGCRGYGIDRSLSLCSSFVPLYAVPLFVPEARSFVPACAARGDILFVLMHSNLRSLLRTAQAMRASLLASAIASTLWCRRFLAASIQDLSP